jgi:hypothetical protein
MFEKTVLREKLEPTKNEESRQIIPRIFDIQPETSVV